MSWLRRLFSDMKQHENNNICAYHQQASDPDHIGHVWQYRSVHSDSAAESYDLSLVVLHLTSVSSRPSGSCRNFSQTRSLLLRSGRGAVLCDQPVCLCVCLFTSISLEPLDRSARNFVCRSPVAVARSSPGGVALR